MPAFHKHWQGMFFYHKKEMLFMTYLFNKSISWATWFYTNISISSNIKIVHGNLPYSTFDLIQLSVYDRLHHLYTYLRHCTYRCEYTQSNIIDHTDTGVYTFF